jgi:thiosulfate reductase cytochrome b subunit
LQIRNSKSAIRNSPDRFAHYHSNQQSAFSNPQSFGFPRYYDILCGLLVQLPWKQPMADLQSTPHRLWVRTSHWLVTASFVTLAFTGVIILMAHPRLYWGEVGNDLTKPLIELPISRNHRHGGWANTTPFFADANSPVTANRTFDIFNKNGWGRSLHFLAGWFFVFTGGIYLLVGFLSRHFRRHIVPRSGELAPKLFWSEVKDHARLRIRAATGGPNYGLLQKCSYFVVIFLVLPLTVVTGLAMSPAVTATYPFLSGMFGGSQSARTIHFLAFVALMLFLLVHVVMIIRSGFKRQMRAMTIGK